MSSNITKRDHTDHVVLDGMHDDKATKCWMQLLRHGVAFRIEVFADELQSTSLLQRWQAIMSETAATPHKSPSDRLDRWEQLCDLLIDTSLPVLENLAPAVLSPESTSHRSLQGCFHTKTYCLRIIKDSTSHHVQASVTNGPIDGSPYGFRTDTFGEFDSLGAGLKQYSSSDITIVETDLSSTPRKVKTPDGALHHFEAYMRNSKRLGTSHAGNHSLEVIHAYLQLRNGSSLPGVPAVSGIVEDEGAFAGILLQDIHAANSLASRLSRITEVEGLEKIRQLVPGWQMQIASLVAQLHTRGYYLNDEISECGVDESRLLVDEKDNIWLPLTYVSRLDEAKREKLTSKDKEAVQRVFERVVPQELARVDAQIGSR